MRRRILPLILGGALSVAAVAPAAATHTTGIAHGGLVNLVVQNVLNNSLNDVIDINDSLNNALQNVLQNARILNNLEVTIQNVLNNLNVTVTDVNIEVLDTGDIQIVVLGAGGTVIDTITLT